jgi:hypothetical protein
LSTKFVASLLNASTCIKKNTLFTALKIELRVREHERKFSFSERSSCLNNAELESLFVESVYTIKHKIGRTIDGHIDYTNDLYGYVRDAFKVSLEDYERLLAKTNEEKVRQIFFGSCPKKKRKLGNLIFF